MNHVTKLISSILNIELLGIPIVLLPISIMSFIIFLKVILLLPKILKKNQQIEASLKKQGSTLFEQISTLTSCIGGALGIGSILAGCISVKLFGPGILFWILVTSIIISGSKFLEVMVSCTPKNMLVWQKSHTKNTQNKFLTSGPFIYIQETFTRFFNKKISIYLTAIFAISFGICFSIVSIVQVNQLVEVLSLKNNVYKLAVSLSVGILVCYFLIRNIKEISIFSIIFVPLMVFVQVFVCIRIVIFSDKNFIDVLHLIFTEAFRSKSFPVQGIAIYALQRMIFASDLGTGISGFLSSESQVENRVKQGALGALEPILTGIMVFLIGVAVVTSGEYLSKKNGVSIVASSIKSSFDSYLFSFSIIMFALTTVVTRAYCAVKSLTFLTNGRFKGIIISLISVAITLSSFMVFHDILIMADFFYIIISTLHLFALVIILNSKKDETIFITDDKQN